MGVNLRIKDAILNGEGEGKTFYEIIEAGEPFGMQTFDQSIIKLLQAECITEDAALSFASRKSVVRREADELKKKQGLMTSDIHELTLDEGYGKTPHRR